MSEQAEKVSTITGVVYSAMTHMRISDMGDYEWLEQLAIDQVRDWNVYHGTDIQVFRSKPSPSKVIMLPRDFSDYVVVGVMMGGQLVTLGVNDCILSGEPVAPCLRDVDEAMTSDLSTLSGYWWLPGSGLFGNQAMFSVGGGFATNYYTIDKTKKVLTLEDAMPAHEIVVQYVSAGGRINGNSVVPWPYIPALRAKIIWSAIENDRTVGYNEKRSKERQFLRAQEAAVLNTDLFTIDELIDTINLTTYQGVKRP